MCGFVDIPIRGRKLFELEEKVLAPGPIPPAAAGAAAAPASAVILWNIKRSLSVSDTSVFDQFGSNVSPEFYQFEFC